MSKFVTLILLILLLFILYCYQNGYLYVKFNLPALNFQKRHKKRVHFSEPKIEEPEDVKSQNESLNLDEISISDLNSIQ